MMNKFYRRIWMASVLILCVCSTAALAQSHTVTGTVNDANSQAMPGVNVILKGTTTGTTTDLNGNFAIQATADDILVISFIGYQTQEIRVGEQTRIAVQLTEDVATLQEVVVVGYGEMRRADLSSRPNVHQLRRHQEHGEHHHRPSHTGACGRCVHHAEHRPARWRHFR
ncbi:MAG: hypothetical protein HC859_16565 [Bacteroidia bacterium]|nr:hypothetical protein [Bacteroidia bacterium]